MTTRMCPICDGPLQQRAVAPCFDCGHVESELHELAAGKHEYHRFRVFGQEIVLCSFCRVDFGSYDPDYFGLPSKAVGSKNYQFALIARIDNPQPAIDFVCENCRHRLAFLVFLAAARQANAG